MTENSLSACVLATITGLPSGTFSTVEREKVLMTLQFYLMQLFCYVKHIMKRVTIFLRNHVLFILNLIKNKLCVCFICSMLYINECHRKI